jgi:hypothetical protein
MPFEPWADSLAFTVLLVVGLLAGLALLWMIF